MEFYRIEYTQKATTPVLSLQVQALRLALALCLHNSLPRRSEIRHLHPHSPLPQRHQPSFGTNGFDIGTGEIVFLVDKFVEIDVVVERHLGGM